MIGETLGKFRILSTIGKGGMGVVYLAEHTLIGRKAAVKLLLPEMSRDEELVERFFNEAKAAAAAQHAGLVEVFDFGWTDDGSAYIVMEHLKGESLAVRLAREGRFGAELALSVARQVASALGAAHEQGVVHRDLKPENIHLLADSGAPAGVRIKILDFGIAKLAREEEHRSVKTRTGVVIGTPRYMSPEQCKSASNVDARTDIYALGCIAYEMLVGKPPFDYDNWGELVAAHIHEAVQPVRMRVPEVSQELEAIVMRAIAKDAGARYQTMAELAQDIDTLWPGARNSMVFTPVPGSLSTIRAVDTAPTIRKSRSRAPMFAMLAGAVVLAGVTAVVVAKREADVEKPAEVAAAPSVVDAAAPMIADAAHVIDSVIMPLSVKIELASNPSGADVLTTTGVNLGKTPLVREYERIDGKLELVVRLAGHQTATVVFDTSVGGKQFVKLVRAKQAVTRPRPQPRPGSGSGVTTLDPYK